MKRALAAMLTLLACLSTPLAAQSGPEARLSDAERAQLLELLEQSKTQYLTLLAGVSNAQWSFKPNPDRWSVGECAEHIVRSNELLYGSAKQALAAATNPDWYEKTKGKSELLLRVMPNRNPGGVGGATAPQEIRPTGEIGRGELVERFVALYDDLETFVRDSEAPLKAHTYEHPFPIFNTLNAYDWILYVPLHTIRHSRQMIEVMETEGYPSG